MILQETEHPRLQLGLELPFLRQRGGRPLAPDDAAQGIIETGLVVEQVETRIGIFPVVFLAVNFRDEEQVGVIGTQRVESPVEEGCRNEFHHVAAETVDALPYPEMQHLQHLAPGTPVMVVEFNGIIPVVERGPGVEHVVSGRKSGVLDIAAVQRFGKMQGFSERIEVLRREIAVILAVHVVGHEVDDDLHAGLVRTGDEGLELGHAIVEIDGQGRVDIEPVADGVGRSSLTLDERGIAVRKGPEMGAGGVGDHAGVPHGADRQLLEFEQHVVGDVVELA